MNITDCSSLDAAVSVRTGPASSAAAAAAVGCVYFRCTPLEATISVQQCRANRARISPRAALQLPFEPPSWWVQPLTCMSCTLAPRVEAGAVPFYSAAEVLAGQARASRVTSSGRGGFC